MPESKIGEEPKKITYPEEVKRKRIEEAAQKPSNVIPIEEGLRKRQERVAKEQSEAKERFGDLISFVSGGYEGKDLDDSQKEGYIVHNDEILDNAIEFGIRERFSEEELLELEMAAILHDMDKVEEVPEEYREIKTYALVMHAKTAAEKVPEVLTDEYLEKKGIKGDYERIRKNVAKAILEHMGPRPGFIGSAIENFNREMEERGGEKVEYPEARGRVSEALLAADMLSLAGGNGRQKVFTDRFLKAHFREADEKLAKEYRALGIEMTPGEVAILSAFDSAFQAREMVKNKKYRKFIEEAIEESKGIEYAYGGTGQKVSWETANAKREEYERKKGEVAARERLRAN